MMARVDYGVYQIYGNHPIYGSDACFILGRRKSKLFLRDSIQKENIGKNIAKFMWVGLQVVKHQMMMNGIGKLILQKGS